MFQDDAALTAALRPAFKAVAALTLFYSPLRPPFGFDQVQTRCPPIPMSISVNPSPVFARHQDIAPFFSHTALFVSRKLSIDVQLPRHLTN